MNHLGGYTKGRVSDSLNPGGFTEGIVLGCELELWFDRN